jgi:hypothetical protein
VTNPIFAPLLAEEARLEAELRANPAYRRLDAVRASLKSLRAVYEIDNAATLPKAESSSAHRVSRAREGSITGSILKIAESSLRIAGKRLTSSELLHLVLQGGVTISSPKPQSVVSSVMSHDARFDNATDHYGTGYGLREWTTPPASAREIDLKLFEVTPSNESDSQRATAESP